MRQTFHHRPCGEGGRVGLGVRVWTERVSQRPLRTCIGYKWCRLPSNEARSEQRPLIKISYTLLAYLSTGHLAL